MKTGWENGNRIPITDGRMAEPVRRADPESLILARRLIGLMLADTNPALGIECLALVTGICYQGSSMVEIANRHMVTRAAVSKRCVELCETFGVPPTRAMRQQNCRERCRIARIRELVES